MSAPAMFRKVAFTMYPATDIPRARKFYEETFGLKVGKNGGHGSIFWVEYDLPGGGCFAITNATQDTPSAGAGGTIAFEVADIDALTADLKSKDVKFLSEGIRGPNCRMAVCLDSEGNSIVLHQINAKG